MPSKKLLIIGSGSQARYVIDIVKNDSAVNLIGLIDLESPQRVGQKINDVPIVGTIANLVAYPAPETWLIIAYGKNDKKKTLAEQFSKQGYQFYSAISAQAMISPFAQIGSGCIVNPHAVIMPNAVIGNHVIIHSNCVIEHDNVIGAYANLAPGVVLAGRVKVGEGTTLYTGVKVIPDISIGDWSMVAAGSLVTKNIPAQARYGGSPARLLPAISK